MSGRFMLDANFAETAAATATKLKHECFDAARFYNFAVADERNELMKQSPLPGRTQLYLPLSLGTQIFCLRSWRVLRSANVAFS